MQYFALVVVTLMVLFGMVAIVDIVFLKGRLALGAEFKKAFDFVGPLMLAMTGIISFVPCIAWVIERTLTPLYEMMHLDPSMAVSTILAIDMGGFQLAGEVAIDPLIGEWAGAVYGSMMGATIVFFVPVGLAAIRKEDTTYFSRGVLFGIAAIPFGTFIGGVMMGIKVGVVLMNLIIPMAFSVIIILAIRFAPRGTIKVFKGFSIFIDAFALLTLGIAILKDFVLVPIFELANVDIESIPFLRLIAPTSEGILVSGNIAMILCGTMPFVYVLNRLLQKPLRKIAPKLGFSEIGMTSLLTTSANSMGMFPAMVEMNSREKIVNIAFAVCASWVIGDHLAFAAANAPKLIAPMMVGKLVSGIIAIVIAMLFTRNMKESTQCVDREESKKEDIEDNIIDANDVEDIVTPTIEKDTKVIEDDATTNKQGKLA